MKTFRAPILQRGSLIIRIPRFVVAVGGGGSYPSAYVVSNSNGDGMGTDGTYTLLSGPTPYNGHGVYQYHDTGTGNTNWMFFSNQLGLWVIVTSGDASYSDIADILTADADPYGFVNDFYDGPMDTPDGAADWTIGGTGNSASPVPASNPPTVVL